MEAVLTLTDQMTGQFRKAAGETTRISNRVNRQMISMNNGVNRAIVGSARAVGIAAGAAAGAIGILAREASKIEDAVAGFTPLLGGVERANELVEMLNETAATTPFQFENISAAAKQLLPVMQGDLEKTVDTFRMLGDTAGGNAQKLDTITRGYTKAMLKGKVDMESLNMIAEAGVPIYSELADSMGVSVQEMMAMSSAGEIASTDLEKAFQNMTSEGGIFFNGMEIASRTLSGKLSTMKDNLALTGAMLGKALLPNLKDGTDAITDLLSQVRKWVKANQELISQKIGKAVEGIKNMAKASVPYLKAMGKTFMYIVKNFHKWKPLLKVVGVLMGIFLISVKAYMAYKFVEGIMSTVKAFGLLSKAQAVLNAVMSANPIALIIIGIAALIVIVVLLVKHWDIVIVKLRQAWDWLSHMLDNPFFLMFATFINPWFTAAAMIVKHWEPLKAFFTGLWNTISSMGIAAFDGVKFAFQAAVTFMERIFFTFADYFITIYATMFKGIVSGAAAIGKLVGLDVSSLEGMISKVEGMQSSVREKSFVSGNGDSQGEQAQNGATAAEKEQAQERSRRDQNSRQRNDVYLHAPQGNGISVSPGGTPAMAVNLGAQ